MDTFLNFAIVGVLGALLGLTELLSRYRDQPATLARVPAAGVYLLVNAAASVAAFILIREFSWAFGQTGTRKVAIQVLVAAFGSAALFRSSLFMVKIGESTVGIGPSTIMMGLLDAASRSVDRFQARQRLTSARDIMQAFDFSNADALVQSCLAAAETVPAEEGTILRQAVQALRQASMNVQGKRITLGLLLIDVFGPAVLREGVAAHAPSTRA